MLVGTDVCVCVLVGTDDCVCVVFVWEIYNLFGWFIKPKLYLYIFVSEPILIKSFSNLFLEPIGTEKWGKAPCWFGI